MPLLALERLARWLLAGPVVARDLEVRGVRVSFVDERTRRREGSPTALELLEFRGRLVRDGEEVILRVSARLHEGGQERGSLEWAEIDTAPWVDLPLGIHRAWTTTGTRAVFSIAGGACRLIAGDLHDLLGVDLAETDALSYALSAWNQLQTTVPAGVSLVAFLWSGQLAVAAALSPAQDAEPAAPAVAPVPPQEPALPHARRRRRALVPQANGFP